MFTENCSNSKYIIQLKTKGTGLLQLKAMP